MDANRQRCPVFFDLAQTLDCGQAFRWVELTREGEHCLWEGAAFGKVLRLEQQGEQVWFLCSREDLETTWREYFDLGEDYEQKRAQLSAMSPALKEAAAFAPGIRILRQEPWEALCSFIISQNNHIPRIKGIIQRLCDGFGEAVDGTDWHAFPTPQTLASRTLEDLAPLRAGFRAKYLLDAARKVASGQVDLELVSRAPVEVGRQELQKIFGVGPKVAECALLYGFHKTGCFPMDVWMKRAMATLLPGRSPQEFGENAGLAQQYLFHYSRLHPELFGEKEKPQSA
ncbi:MAG: DNA-3-methyladenine glycosylase family protein [Acutalibacter sp.]